ncbi:lipase B [Colletotrichum spaethianum]|uniref:Lipase B n=1 Tax=Colletotrichum spaethianum TaxID=700344 RepID=A0AA37NWX2_9PEZI|nr:lipase B [Colletotrichum spaethianum]GKT41750.1 lipase B [Colletotrichum spaethianum]
MAVAIAAPAPAPIPIPAPNPVALAAPGPLPEPLSLNDLNPIPLFAPVVQDQLANLASQLASTTPTSTPKDIPDAVATLKGILGPQPTGLLTNGLSFLQQGLQVSGTKGKTINSPDPPGQINSFNQTNPQPSKVLFPKADAADPPFQKSEQELRSAIFIPTNFVKGNNPVLLVPGTGAYGGSTYEGNMIKIMAQDPSIGQAAWVNVPLAMLDDVQTNAEHIAYAINYMADMTGQKVAVVGWSQGNLATQWALKHWSSTRANTKQLVSFSPDFHGTTIAALTDFPIISSIPVGPSLIQQKYDSNLVKTLRADDGDSAYVPTTTIYSSSFDEIVQPQAGEGASAFLKDARKVGVFNAELQRVCPNTPAGDFGTHESVMFNGLATALVIDALKNGGPADPGRLDLKTVCQQLAHPALNVTDVQLTEGTIPLAALNVVEFKKGVTDEPPIRDYAAKKRN